MQMWENNSCKDITTGYMTMIYDSNHFLLSLALQPQSLITVAVRVKAQDFSFSFLETFIVKG